MAEKPQQETPTRTKRRRWARLAFWLVIAGFVLLLLLSAAGCWAWRNRTPLANGLLRKTFAAFDAQLGTLDVDVSSETVLIHDITVRDPDSGEIIAKAGKLVWQPDLRTLNLGRFRLELRF